MIGPMDGLDRLFSVEELAGYLGVPVATLYAWRYRGQGPVGFRVGRHVRYRHCDIQAWIDEQLNDANGDVGLVSQPRGRVGSRKGREKEGPMSTIDHPKTVCGKETL